LRPDFVAKGGIIASAKEKTTSAALRSSEKRDVQSIAFASKLRTKMEVVALERRVKKAGWQVQAYLGPNGTEAELRATNSSCILDLAPHMDFSFPKLALVPTERFVTNGRSEPQR
jgi:hypothetical protein